MPARSSCRERDGQTKASLSISAGLDYPGVGPQHMVGADGARSYMPFRRRGHGCFPPVAHGGHHSAIGHSRALAGVRAWAAKAEAEGPFAPGEEPIAIVTVSGRGKQGHRYGIAAVRLPGHAKLQVIDLAGRQCCRPG